MHTQRVAVPPSAPMAASDAGISHEEGGWEVKIAYCRPRTTMQRRSRRQRARSRDERWRRSSSVRAVAAASAEAARTASFFSVWRNDDEGRFAPPLAIERARHLPSHLISFLPPPSNPEAPAHPGHASAGNLVGACRARAFRHSRRCGQNWSFFARLSPAPHTSCLARRSQNWQGVVCFRRRLATSLRTLLLQQSTMRKRR